MRRVLTTACYLLLAAGLLTAIAAQTDEERPPATGNDVVIDGQTPDQRMAAFVRWCAATRPGKPKFAKEAAAFYLARLLVGRDTDYALRGLDACAAESLRVARAKHAADAADPNPGEPFDKHALVNAYVMFPDKLPPATVDKIKALVALWAHREYRGYGAMNYRLMKDGAGYLAAERWPDLRDADGLDAPAIRAATAQRLYEYFTTLTHRNCDEWNAPTYYACDLMPIRMLAEYAADPTMRQRATLTLDWMLVDLACSWNQGYYVSSAGRAKYWSSTATSPDGPDGTAGVGWFFYGGRRGIRAAHACPYHAFWMAYPGRYRLPDAVVKFAQQRDRPFADRETVASTPYDIRKLTWHSTSFSLASQFEDRAKPDAALYKETRRSMLKWLSDKPGSVLSVQQENLLRPYRPKDVTPNSFGYGENPYMQVLQHEGTLLGVWNVPDKFPFYKVYVPFPLTGSIVKRVERDGWVLCHGGSMLFGFKPLGAYTWGRPTQGCDLLWVDARRGGYLLEASELTPFAGGGVDAELQRFGDALAAKAKVEAGPLPTLRYTTLSGHRLELTWRAHATKYTDQHKVDGAVVDYSRYPLLDNPSVHQAVDGDQLTVTSGGQSVVWDFGRWTVTGDGR